MKKHPSWIRKNVRGNREKYTQVKEILQKQQLHTVCQEAQCPNLGECWGYGSVTFMILGDACTRSCNFCAVKAQPLLPPDPKEPVRLATAIQEMGLHYVVLTSVTRDDLPDQGSSHYAQCIQSIKARNPEVIVEALIPDFQGTRESLHTVVNAEPEVIGHNVETVKRLQTEVRDPRASYEQSLKVLETINSLDADIYTKSSLMLGLGETEQEVLQAMDDLREVDVDILTLGQYLRPTKQHLEVHEYIPPDKFTYYQERAQEKGFLYTVSGPFVRSSYKSSEFFMSEILSPPK